MPSFETAKRIFGGGRKLGQVRKDESDMLMEATWDGDIASRTAWIYDMYHDPNPRKLRNINPENDYGKIPLEIKFVKHTTQTLDKDAVSFHLLMKPDQECNIPYYEEYEKMYGMEWPLGLYVDIPDDKGRFNRWLVVAPANADDTQFPTWEILKCDYCFQYVIFENNRRVCKEVAGVRRSQNSYNSGVWFDFRIQTIENQDKFIVPLNRDTEKLFYDQRLIIDSKVLTEPICWAISKINRLSPNGLVRATVIQKQFDPHMDYIEFDQDGNVVGMWASYYSDGVSADNPQEDADPSVYSEITFSGAKTPQLKIGGNAKTFTVSFYREGVEINHKPGVWSYKIDGIDVSDLVETSIISENKVKIKFIGDDKYIGEEIIISYTSESGIKSSVKMNLVGI